VVVIAPLRIGGGTRLKIVEAMAMGKPVVATPLGAEGLEVTDGEDILLADSAADFAGQVARVLGDATLARRLGEAARQRAESQYTWQAAADRLECFYRELRLPSPAFAAAESGVPAPGQEANVADAG
jgi:glycosyltransferase involved in cell wall biosynthesis